MFHFLECRKTNIYVWRLDDYVNIKKKLSKNDCFTCHYLSIEIYILREKNILALCLHKVDICIEIENE